MKSIRIFSGESYGIQKYSILQMNTVKEWVVYKDQKRKLSKQMETLMTGETIWFEDGEWKQHNLGRACLLIKKWFAKQILIVKAENKEMIREIVNIKFPNLTYISLQQNNIESVESLSRIRFPKLRQLHLDENQITNLRDVRKMRCKFLNQIKINHNLCVDCQALTELRTDSQIKSLHIEEIWNHEMSFDMRWVFKIYANKMQEIYIGSRKRIREEVLIKGLKKRFYKIHKLEVAKEID